MTVGFKVDIPPAEEADTATEQGLPTTLSPASARQDALKVESRGAFNFSGRADRSQVESGAESNFSGSADRSQVESGAESNFGGRADRSQVESGAESNFSGSADRSQVESGAESNFGGRSAGRQQRSHFHLAPGNSRQLLLIMPLDSTALMEVEQGGMFTAASGRRIRCRVARPKPNIANSASGG